MQSLANEIAAPRTGAQESVRPLFLWPEWAAASLFTALVACAIPYHEPWSDEAQAWQLARTLPLSTLFRTYVRYEATPGLWHFLLWVLSRIGVSYSSLHWISGAVAVAAASLLVFKAPFPRFLRLTLPFTYFLLFQYAVIARSYILAPLFFFLIALSWKKSPIVVSVLLGLLANVSLHAAVLSGGLAIVYLFRRLRRQDEEVPHSRREVLLAALIILAFYAFAIWTAFPPHDLPIAGFRGESRPFLACAVVSIVLGICQPWFLAIPFWVAIAICLFARRGFSYLLPVLFFAIFSGAAYALFWHAGLLVPFVICVLWITWPAATTPLTWQEKTGRAALAVMIVVQLLWSAHALVYDHYHAYSPARATARFLEPYVRDGASLAVTYVDQPQSHDFDDVALLPYFGRNIYINQSDPFFWWSDKNSSEAEFSRILPSHPRLVLLLARPKPGEPIKLNDPKVDLIARSGYRLTNHFCGRMPARLDFAGGPTCNLIFQYAGAPQPTLSPWLPDDTPVVR
jgi:hypothetical protein